VLCLGFAAPVDLQHKFIDAAAEAGVEYVFPVEFGSDTDDEKLGEAVPLMAGKKKVREYIESVGKSKWIGIIHNPWLTWVSTLPASVPFLTYRSSCSYSNRASS